MKKLICLFAALMILCSCAVNAFAADGKVTYSGDAGKFIFSPGSENSPTDLFPEFKDVMPGDTLTQRITVKNDASDKVKVKIYIRSKGAQADSAEFLPQLHLRVAKSEENTMTYMFDASADQTAQLMEWVLLGTLYSGGEVNLDVSLDVPTTLDNAFQSQAGSLDWEFMVEEFPVEPDDPKPPQSGDRFPIVALIALMAVCAVAIVFLLILRKNRQEKEEPNEA